jgi:hypothetical protein
MQSRSSTELQRSRHGTPMLLSGLRPQHYRLTCRERPLVQSYRSRLSVSGGGADMPHRQAEVAF